MTGKCLTKTHTAVNCWSLHFKDLRQATKNHSIKYFILSNICFSLQKLKVTLLLTLANPKVNYFNFEHFPYDNNSIHENRNVAMLKAEFTGYVCY